MRNWSGCGGHANTGGVCMSSGGSQSLWACSLIPTVLDTPPPNRQRHLTSFYDNSNNPRATAADLLVPFKSAPHAPTDNDFFLHVSPSDSVASAVGAPGSLGMAIIFNYRR